MKTETCQNCYGNGVIQTVNAAGNDFQFTCKKCDGNGAVPARKRQYVIDIHKDKLLGFFNQKELVDLVLPENCWNKPMTEDDYTYLYPLCTEDDATFIWDQGYPVSES